MGLFWQQTEVIGFVPIVFFLLRRCLGLGVMVYCSGGCCFTADLVVVNGVSGCPLADPAMVWWW